MESLPGEHAACLDHQYPLAGIVHELWAQLVTEYPARGHRASQAQLRGERFDPAQTPRGGDVRLVEYRSPIPKAVVGQGQAPHTPWRMIIWSNEVWTMEYGIVQIWSQKSIRARSRLSSQGPRGGPV